MKKKLNFLDVIPEKSTKIKWESTNKGTIKILVPRDKWLDKAVRKFTKTPEHFKIDLDAHGSYVWECIDGTSTVHDISKKVHNQFGDKAEPLLDRLVTYMRILKNNNFISYKKED